VYGPEVKLVEVGEVSSVEKLLVQEGPVAVYSPLEDILECWCVA